MKHWLMKSELDVYPFSQLVADGQTHWDGVRNYQARNMMRDDMKLGDLVLFYHSNTKPPHVAGVAKIVTEGYPDHTSWDRHGNYYDEKSTPESPRWFMVDIAPVRELAMVSLDAMRENPALEGMLLLRRGQRLSVQPVEEEHFAEVVSMAGCTLDDVS
ncbi:MAG: EVE domain-containing protein [Candidatus Poseidonia sp.]|nr:EVE domain-containing protein [Poseidonia sp.]